LQSDLPRKPAVVAASAYVDGRRIAEVALAEAGEWARRPRHVVWIGLHEPSADYRPDLHSSVLALSSR